jgi:DNA-binding response OmpR family regulator
MWDGVERRSAASVLVVSDDEGALELLIRLLEQAGYDATPATAIDTAMQAAHEDLPRCIVLDMRIGGIGSNLKLLDMVRGSDDRRIASTRAVIVGDNPRNRGFSFQSGADAFIVRPYRASHLLDAVKDVVARPDTDRARHRRDELKRHGQLLPQPMATGQRVERGP